MTQHNWDLSKIYANDAARLEAKENIESQLAALHTLAGGGKDALPEILPAVFDLQRLFSSYYGYTMMSRDVNTKDPSAQRMQQESDGMEARFTAATAFVRPLLLSLTEEEVEELLQKPDMARFRITIDRIRRYKDHTLSTEEERILSSLDEVGGQFQNAFFMLSFADMRFPDMEDGTPLTQSNYISLLESQDPAIRKEAFTKYYDTYDKVKNTLAADMYGNVVANVRKAQLRNFSGARQAALFEDDVDEQVYDALVEAVSESLPALQEYYRIKGRAQGLDPLHMYDVYLPVDTGQDAKVAYETAQSWLLEAVAPLGEEYSNVVKEAFRDRWIDVYPKDGKQSGAYSGGSYDSVPYILLNFTDNLDSAFTLAHEMGHSVHSKFARDNNTFEDHGYTIFVAEVASTFNELLLLDYLKKRADSDAERLRLVDHLLNSFKSTVFRQTMFAEFEHQTHRRVEDNGTLTDEELRGMYYALNEKYFADSVVLDQEIALEYARIPHFYRAFYVYKYATGFLSSVLLSRRVLDKEEGAVESYLAFLKDGGKHFPLDQLKKAGVDLTDPAVLKEGLTLFEELVEEFRELTK